MPPAFTYTLTRGDGSTPNLPGATVALNLRQLSSTSTLELSFI